MPQVGCPLFGEKDPRDLKKKILKEPQLKKNSDYVGNIKANSKSIEYKQLVKFLEQYFKKYIITIESANTENEHCHFWAQKCKLKDNDNQSTILSHYFTRDLPSLKRDGKGGANKKLLKIMKEEFQFYYIFKEQENIKKIKNYRVVINQKNLKKYKELYAILKQAKKRGKWGEFLQYCVDTHGADNWRLTKRSLLIEDYINWADASGTCPTINLCDRYVNGVLVKYSKNSLTSDFKNIINNKYNKEYF